MKSCFSPLQGARPRSAQSQFWSAAPSFVCARALMFTGEEEEEGGASAGMEGGRGGLELFKDGLYIRDLLFSQHGKRETWLFLALWAVTRPVCLLYTGSVAQVTVIFALTDGSLWFHYASGTSPQTQSTKKATVVVIVLESSKARAAAKRGSWTCV